MEKSLYQRLLEANCELDSHYSDLYVKATPEARAIIDEYRKEKGLTNGWGLGGPFVSQIDGQTWIDLPFFYEPYWIAHSSPQPTTN